VIDGLMGGSPAEWPERYAQGAVFGRVPDVPQVVIVGVFDDKWRGSGLHYVRHAARAGAPVRLFEAGASGHFEVIDPDSTTWPLVRKAARGLLGLN
ncbi:MAG: alpha/beta hydrolase, partial [Gammaproteobacteria bacterium]|nr:alpha/beta hydrolase [Gammaproteobacteria bacterium]